MATIHRTTLVPSKLDLLTAWLPSRPWFVGGEPELAKAGGFRLDDPAGEVGIEFLAARDDAGARPVVYHVPMTYRAAPLAEADHALIGTAEHGVLGKRWIYDAAHDPVFVAELCALLNGRTEAQAQSVNDTPEPTVAVRCTSDVVSRMSEVTDGPDGTDIRLGESTIRVLRTLVPGEETDAAGAIAGSIVGEWRLDEETPVRGLYFQCHRNGSSTG